MSLNTILAEEQAILDVEGTDGNVLLSDHPEISSFQGVLPATPDYCILIRCRPEGSSAYSITASLPPLL